MFDFRSVSVLELGHVLKGLGEVHAPALTVLASAFPFSGRELRLQCFQNKSTSFITIWNLDKFMEPSL